MFTQEEIILLNGLLCHPNRGWHHAHEIMYEVLCLEKTDHYRAIARVKIGAITKKDPNLIEAKTQEGPWRVNRKYLLDSYLQRPVANDKPKTESSYVEQLEAAGMI